MAAFGGLRRRLCAALLAAVPAVVCAGAAATELRLLNWAEYTAPALLERFEQETGIRVVVETYAASDALPARLEAEPGRYDLAVVAEYAVPRLAAAGALETVAVRALPGFANVDEPWRAPHYDPEARHSVPWHWGTTSFLVDTTRYDGDIDSLAVLFDPPPALRGPVGVLYEAAAVFGMALRHLGLPPCSHRPEDLARVEVLLAARAADYVVLTGDDLPVARERMRLAVSMAWNGHAMRVRAVRPGVRYAYPREGVSVWTDALVVPKGAPHPVEAQRFMSFLLRPENAALQTNHTRYATAVRGSEAFLDRDLLDAPEIVVPPSARLEFPGACPAAVYDGYQAIWNRVTRRAGVTPPAPGG